MTRRELVSDDGRVRRYRVLDDAGTPIGADEETVPTVAEVNVATLTRRAQVALAANAEFLTLATPTAAQNAAQVKALTRQVSALARLLLDQTDTTEGT